MPDTGIESLFFRIAYCDVALGVLDGAAQNNPCSTIVLDQQVRAEDFQLPVPWVGHLEKAPLLFISSNPSIGNDRHALRRSSRQEVWDSHVRLFDAETGLTRNGIYPTDENGNLRRTYVRHWAFARSRAKELLQRDIRPGIDYALTEVAHCKTRRERGVAECAAFCADRFLRSVIDASAANLLVAMGLYAHREIRRLYSITTAERLTTLPNGRRVVFMPHSNFRGPRTFAAVMPEHLSELRRHAQHPLA